MKEQASTSAAARKRSMAHDTTLRANAGICASFAVIIGVAMSLVFFSACGDRDAQRRSIVAGGDCLLDRHDGSDPRRPSIDRRWDAIAAACAGSDAFLCNLETTVGHAGTARPARFVFRAPETDLDVLLRFSRPMVALANNHVMDYGPEGLLSTLAALDARGIGHAGAGGTEGLANEGRIVDLSGISFGFLSFGFDNELSSYSDERGACIAPLDPDRMAREVSSLARTTDFTVVMLHWGNEYDSRITVRQREIARRLADSGADAILGVGPHVLQGIERYRDCLICYSLGNLVFDDLGNRETTATILVVMNVSREKGKIVKRFEIAPLRTSKLFEGPAAPTKEDSLAIVRSVAERSPDNSVVSLRPRVDASSISWFRVRE